MTFIKLPHGIWNLGISSSQLVVYLALLKHSNRLSHCIVKYETLAALTGMSVSSVIRAISHLQSRGLITVDKRHNLQGNLVANRYFISPISGGYAKIPTKIFSLGLGKSVFKVYVYMLSCRNTKTLEAIPSLNRMASTLKMSKRTIVDGIALLSSRGIVFKTSYKRITDGGNGHNRHIVLTAALRKILFALLHFHFGGVKSFNFHIFFKAFYRSFPQSVEKYLNISLKYLYLYHLVVNPHLRI